MNREIRAQQIRVIDDEGNMLGVMTVPEALRIAEDRGLDLLEIAPTASPPTCKIMDYGKWKYEKKKQATAARKKQTVVTIKEVQMRPRTDQHDFETKMNHARRFLLDGDKVKVSLRFMGRELAHQELGMEVMQKAIAFVNDLALIESNPKMEGKQMFLMLAPDPVKIKDYQKAHPNKSKQDTKELADLEELEEDDEE
ncbi:translation initiation factor IF-3 [Bdellovibrio sp. NC01]|uniref:translation initiation factor IF-3 n=1 Tax=Bdellovibrio sp. NC01 TaxID=2220073 RepID=UPI001FEDC0B0|nr:translation initiation factor IF-3 [Bdellovibrio sp. NC01]